MTAARVVHVEVGLVRGLGALGPAAAVPVDGQLALALLVDEVGGQVANEGRIAVPIRLREATVTVVTVLLDRAEDPEGKEAAERAAVEAGSEGNDGAERERHEQDERDELDRGLATLVVAAPAASPARPPAARTSPGERQQRQGGAADPREGDRGLPEAERVACEEAGRGPSRDAGPEHGRE